MRAWIVLTAVLTAVLALGCSPNARDQGSRAENQEQGAQRAEPATGSPAVEEPDAAEAEAEAEAKADGEAGAETGADADANAEPSFDPLTAEAARVRITKILADGPPCGIVHAIGLIEVEVLDAGDPPPTMALYISCPADVGRGVLTVGNVVRVKFHKRRQSWPRPRTKLPPELPTRDVKAIELDAAAP